TDYNTAARGGLNSLNPQASFINTNNGTILNGCYRGANLTTNVPVDLNGVTRPASPSIGCYESVPSSVDAAVDAIVLTQPFAPGLQNISVTVRNNGSSNIIALNISYSLNNGALVTENWTGNLAACATTNVTFTGAKQGNFSGG